MSELDRIITLPAQPAMTQQPRVVVQSPGDVTARQIPFWRAVEDVIRNSSLVPDPAAPGMHVIELEVSAGGTSFPGLLPTEPDTSGGKTVFIYVRGTGLFTLTTGTPGNFEFALSGDTEQDATFGQAIEAGDIAVAVYAGRTALSDPRYLYLTGWTATLPGGAVPFAWIIPSGVVGVLPVDADGSKGYAFTDATVGDAAFDLVHDNGTVTVVGTITFSSGGGSPTFVVASEVAIAAGDKLYPVNPNPANASLAGVFLTIRLVLT